MQCPKCQEEQSSKTQCECCGIIFEKYRRHLKEEVVQHMNKRAEARLRRNERLCRAHRTLALFYVLLPVPFMVYIIMNDLSYIFMMWFFLFFAIIAGVHLAVSQGVREGKTWARIVSCIIAAFMLTGFPIGTAIGVYLLIYACSKWQPEREARQALAG